MTETEKELRAMAILNNSLADGKRNLGELTVSAMLQFAKLFENTWISVKDELPDKCGTYLVYGNCTGDGVKVDIANLHRNADGFYFGKYHQPTHWMPLPEIPSVGVVIIAQNTDIGATGCVY